MEAYIGIGSNLGDRLHIIRGAVAAFRSHTEIQVLACSSIHESEALVRPGAEAQPRYLNAVIKIDTAQSADALLTTCQGIEQAFGRHRSPGTRWEARTLDLDILHTDGTVSADPRLTLPHPRLGERAFVLVPLAEIAPALHLPEPIDASIEYLLSNLTDAHTVTRLPLDEPL